MVTIIDYGVGNLNSIRNMLRKCDIECIITDDADEVKRAERILLPGVGAFDAAMERLKFLNLEEAIKSYASDGRPVLGICLGAQLLLDGSDEGTLPGLGLIKGKCCKFNASQISPLRVPHMGWSEVNFNRLHPLLKFGNEVPRFYFVHSYHMVCEDERDVLATAKHGIEFTCIIHRDNIVGVQFHPEKSHKFGATLLSNFIKI